MPSYAFSLSKLCLERLKCGPCPHLEKDNFSILSQKFKRLFLLFQVSDKKINYSKKQKILYIWKNQEKIAYFCHYSF